MINNPRQRPRYAAAAAIAMVATLAALAGAAERPHIVLFLGDDLGMPNLDAYNAEALAATPEIDRMAAEGCRFYDAHAPAAVCTPTRYGVLTGRYPFRSRLAKGVLNAAYEPPLLKDEAETVAGLLKRAGYATAAFGKWHLGVDFANAAGNGAARPGAGSSPFTTKDVDFTKPVRHHAVDHGFDYFFGLASSVNHDPYSFIENDRLVAVPTTFRPQYSPPDGGGMFREGWIADGWSDAQTCPRILDQATSHIRRHFSQAPAQPLFVYYASPAPHRPWVPPSSVAGRQVLGAGNGGGMPRHSDMVTMNDVEVGGLRRALEDPNGDGHTVDSVLDNTLFIVTSDNGATVGLLPPYRESKGSIYEGGHRVPFIVRWPGKTPAGSRSDALLGLHDLYATFAAITGTPLAANSAVDSRNVLAALCGSSQGAPNLLTQKAGGSAMFAWREGPWKLVDAGRGQPELYDLAADPGEKVDMAAKMPQRVQAMSAALERLVGDYRRRLPQPQANPRASRQRRAKNPPAAATAPAAVEKAPAAIEKAAVATDAAARPNIVLCIADDMSWAHTSAAGYPAVRTPHFDGVAAAGVRFTQAFCSSPSCTPSRGALLTGQAFCRLEQGASLLSTLPARFAVYPDVLEKSGYAVGYCGKGWDPGDWRPGGRSRNPAGPQFASFAAFLEQVPPGKPFCFWMGSTDPHRPYAPGSGAKAGIDPAKVVVPPIVPDTPELRSDLADYLFEVQRFDQAVGDVVKRLEERGVLADTLLAVTSDNGMPYPRGKCNVYAWGTRMPLAIAWPARIPAKRVVDDFVSLTDLAPTFVAAAGAEVPAEMTGQSLLPLLLSNKSGRIDPARQQVFFGRERHDSNRLENGQPVGYPTRAVRTDKFLYIRNFKPDRFPGGDNPEQNQDNDRGPAKTFVVSHRDDPATKPFYQRAYGRRPAEELYDLVADPAEQINVAADAAYAADRARLRNELDAWMTAMGDPRRPAGPDPDIFDRYPVHARPRAVAKR